MATKTSPKKKRREDPEAVPDPFDSDEPDVEDTDDDGPKLKRKVGRPKKTKVKVDLPPEIRRTIALTPLRIPQVICGVVTGGALTVAYEKEALDGVVKAFTAWADTMEVELSPMMGFFAACGVAAGTGRLVPNPGVKVEPEKPAAAQQAAPATDAAPGSSATPAEKPVKGTATVVKFEKREGTDGPVADGGGSGSSASA